MTNPLLPEIVKNTDLPAFSKIKPEHIKPAVEQAITDCKKIINDVLEKNTHFTWENLIQPIDEVDDVLSKLWSPVSNMNSVVSSDELREAYESCLPLLSEYGTFVGQHQGLFKAYESLKNSQLFNTLDTAKQKAITNALRDFKLSGIALNDEDKKRYGEIVSRLSDLGSSFSNNVLDATHAFTVNITDEEKLTGLPESALAAAKALAESQETTGYTFTLDFPSYLPVMTYCDNRELREKMYGAFVTRASDQGPNAGEFDNSDIMNETLALRHELANLLGFNSYGDMSLATKMAKSTDEVMDFLQGLAVKSKDQGEQDVQELLDFALSEYSQSDLKAWDLAYYSEKLKQNRYAISDEELRPYFPKGRVVNGLFEVVHKLYGLNIKERSNVDTWHEDVNFYDVFDSTGELRGSFYLDLYARAKKRGGAWMDDCVGRNQLANGDIQYPVAYLTCNFNGPVGDTPALFTHDPLTLAFYKNKQFQGWVDTLIKTKSIRKILIFSAAMAQFARHHSSSHRVIDLVDIDSDKWRQYAETKSWPQSWIYQRESKLLLDYEKKITHELDSTCVVSQKEATIFKQLAPEDANKIMRKIKKDVMLIAHGAAMENPKDAQYMLNNTSIDGFWTGSSTERIPIEKAVTATAKEFAALRFPKKKK